MSTHLPPSHSQGNDEVLDRRFLLGGLTGIAGIAALSAVARIASAGPLNPPAGAVGSTGRTLLEVEPRTPLSLATTPGDVDSVFKIVQPGSYYLTGNLTGEAGKHGIEIAASDVTIDLCGFAVIGVVGSLDGITCRTSGFSNAAVYNGTVRGWGGMGLNLTTNSVTPSRAERVRALGNTGAGIRVNGVVIACEAASNGGAGIVTGQGSLVVECHSRDNTAEGYAIGSDNAVARCVSFSNTGRGFDCGSTVNLTDCTATNNGAEGIFLFNGSVVSRCTVRSNTGPGIVVANGNLVTGCIASGNGGGTGGTGAGIRTTSTDNRIEGNNCASNGFGIQAASSGNFISRNTCSANGVNWSIIVGNIFLAVQAATNAAAVNGATGGVAPGSTDPNANFSF